MARRTDERIIDTHIHILRPSMWHYHWLNEHSPLRRDSSLSQIKDDMRACKVGAGILIEATNTSEEIGWLLEMSSRSFPELGVIGWISPDQYAQVAVFAQNSLFKGIRLNWLEPRRHVDIRSSILRCVDAHDLVVDLLTKPECLPSVAELAVAYPNVTFVLDHMGGIDMQGCTPGDWRADLQIFAQLSNVIGKISGFSGLDSRQMIPTVRELVDVAVDIFGSERLLFGSNIPFGLDQYTYADIVNSLHHALQPLPEHIKVDICYQTAVRVYRLRQN